MKNVFVCIKNAFLQDVRYPCNFVFGMLTPLLSLIPLMITIQMFQRQSDLAWYLIGLIIWMYLTQIIWGNGVILKNEKQMGTLEQLWEYPKVCVNLQTDVRYNYSVWRLFLWQEEKTAHKKQQ